MADNETTTPVADAANMPFTHFVSESEATFAREHPGQTQTKFADTDIGKIILEQEAKVAQDFAAGRISEADYNSFRELGESRVESLKEHLTEVGEEFGENITAWKHDAVESWNQFKEEHPEVVADLGTADPSVASVAATGGLMVEVVDPLIDPVTDGVHDILDTMKDELGDTAHEFVEARSDQRGVDRAEIQETEVRVEVVVDKFNEEIEKGHQAMDAWRDEAHAGIEKGNEALQDFAEAHPDSTVTDVNPAAIEVPHIRETIQEETGIAEA